MFGLSNPRVVYGIHSVTPYNISNGLFFGMFRVLAGSTFTLSGETVELRGGSNRFSWAVEDGNVSADLSLNCREYPDFLFELFLGKAPTVVNAEASGNCSTLTNKLGTSTVAATGIVTATVKAAEKSDLKFGKYVVKVTDPTHVDVYGSTNIDFARGTDKDFETDLLKITSAPLAIAQGAPATIPGVGLELTGGAGVIGMTVGDTATFEVRPITTGSNITATFGGLSDVFPVFGALLYSQQRGNGEMMEIDAFSVKAVGCSLGAEEKAFSSWNVTGKAFYDANRSGVFSIRHIKP